MEPGVTTAGKRGDGGLPAGKSGHRSFSRGARSQLQKTTSSEVVFLLSLPAETDILLKAYVFLYIPQDRKEHALDLLNFRFVVAQLLGV